MKLTEVTHLNSWLEFRLAELENTSFADPTWVIIVEEIEFVPNRLVRWPKSKLLSLCICGRGLFWGGASNFPEIYCVLETPLSAIRTEAFVYNS